MEANAKKIMSKYCLQVLEGGDRMSVSQTTGGIDKVQVYNEGKKEPEKLIVPIPQKITLTIKEAAAYSSIGINKLETLLRNPRCTFVLYVGTKKLVKRKEFERFIANSVEI